MAKLSRRLDDVWVGIEISQARITQERYNLAVYQLTGAINATKGIFAKFKVEDFDRYQEVRSTFDSEVEPKAKTVFESEEYNEEEITEALLALMSYIEYLRDVIHECDAYDDQIQLPEDPKPIQALRQKQ